MTVVNFFSFCECGMTDDPEDTGMCQTCGGHSGK